MVFAEWLSKGGFCRVVRRSCGFCRVVVLWCFLQSRASVLWFLPSHGPVVVFAESCIGAVVFAELWSRVGFCPRRLVTVKTGSHMQCLSCDVGRALAG